MRFQPEPVGVDAVLMRSWPMERSVPVAFSIARTVSALPKASAIWRTTGNSFCASGGCALHERAPAAPLTIIIVLGSIQIIF